MSPAAPDGTPPVQPCATAFLGEAICHAGERSHTTLRPSVSWLFLQSLVGCASMEEGMRFTPPALMESEVGTLVLQTLPSTLSLIETGRCLPWAERASLPAKGKAPSLLGEVCSLPEQSKTVRTLSLQGVF